MIIKNNLLDDNCLNQLDELVGNPSFAWYLQEEQVEDANDGCWFSHRIYDIDKPVSFSYVPIMEIFENYLKYVSLCRITVNLLLRQETSSMSVFHTDFQNNSKITTAIFYLNTNNGATEFEDGDRIDCVRNRLIMFPASTSHRANGQTDVSKRIVFNFNFIE
tara:strand:+ start:1031 stop:1516 length:486 start_codon:yes stop_codon:yes gene_type:complete